MNPIAVQALRSRLASNGFRPVEVCTGAKKPSRKEWQTLARQNPPDAARAWPSSDALNTGILCDGLIAVDVDVDNASLVPQLLDAAKHYLGNAPTRTRTDSSRALILYRASEGEPSKRSLNGALGKVEVLGKGQQFVAFGIHPNGESYAWPYGGPDGFHRDSLTPVSQEALTAFLGAIAPLIDAEAPAQALTPSTALPSVATGGMVTDRDREYAAMALADEVSRLTAMTEGMGRNNALNNAAHNMGTLIGNGSIEAGTVACALLNAANQNGYIAKRGEDTARKTIESGINAGIKKPRPLLSLPADIEAIDLGPMIRKGIEAYKLRQPAKEWPTPLNEDAYIGIAGDFIRLVAPQTEGDPCALLIAFLTVVGSMVGRGAYMEIGATRHYVNLFSVIVAETSKGRKGTVMAEAKRFARMIDPTISARMLGGLSSGEGLIEAVRDPRYDDSPIENGKIPIAKVIDNGVGDKRLLVTESEMGQALQAAGRDGNTLSATLRMAWDGDELRTLARSNKNVCREPHISIFGNITLDELQRLLTSTDRNNGFANRFLWVCARRSQLLPWGGNVDDAALQELAAKTSHVINQAAYYGKCGWASDAASMWAREYACLSSGRAGLSGAMSARAEAQTLRVALIYAILDGCNNVDVHHLRAALEVWRYCQDSVDYCFGTASGDTTADRILNMLASTPEGASLTQISAYFGRNKSKDELQRALDTLRTSGKARFESRKTGGRAAVVWFAC